ncbi:hypothetical protein ACIF70_41440 [Actinacidiphila glaucinigra]|uniref:hypothetical protein n=1 Tax=Actinacidiphila glaucinigra TaxID=235986 RepID=UPI0037CA7B3B
MRGISDEQLHETEQVLRLLMKDALPGTVPPADHLAQVGRKIQRRMRRRVAIAGAAASLVAAVAYTTVAQIEPEPGQKDITAPAASPATNATRGLTTVHLPNLSGLTLQVPQGWTAAASENSREANASFVSSQLLHAPPHDSCSSDQDKVLGACPPITALNKGEVLMAFQDIGVNALSDTMPLVMDQASHPNKHCQALKGDTQMNGVGRARASGSGSGEPFDVSIFVCLREPSDQTLAAVRETLEAFTQSQG